MENIFTIVKTVSEYVKLQVNKFVLSDKGASAAEYSLMAALIGATVLVSQAALGQVLAAMYTTAIGVITSAMGS